MSVDDREQLLVRTALAKKRAGEKLTGAERTALDRVRKQTLFDLLREIAPATFEELFGIQANQRHQWEDVLKIPCGRGRDPINMLDVASSIREVFSKRMELATDTPGMAEKKLEKLEQEVQKLLHQNFRHKTENEMLARERMPKAEIVTTLEKMADIIRGAGDQMGRKNRLSGEEAQGILNNALSQFCDELTNLRTL